MRRCSFPLALIAFVVSACGGDATGPMASLCSVQSGAEVCVARAEYRQADLVSFTTRNTGSAPIFKDGCSTRLVGKTTEAAEFEAVFKPSLRCGSGATLADIVANMVELGPGESFEETLQLTSFAFQGFYRANVWILNSDGTLAGSTPAHSGTFRVFPSPD